MQAGTVIRLPDGRIGTTVYHFLDGYGIVWGKVEVDLENLPEPQAMLRENYSSAGCECVGEEYEVIS